MADENFVVLSLRTKAILATGKRSPQVAPHLFILLCFAFVPGVRALDETYSSLQAKAAGAFREGKFAEAELALRSALKSKPNDAATLGRLGVVLDAQQKYDEAQRFYERARACGPATSSLLNNLGNHYLAIGDQERARAEFLQALAIDPHHQNVLLQLARIAVDRRQGTEARKYLNGVTGLGVAVQLLRVQALYWGGDQKEAVALMERIEQAAADQPSVLFAAGMALVQMEQYERAEAAFSKVLQASPGDFDALHNLGLAAIRAGHLERAQRALEAALRYHPDDVDSILELGRLCAERQNFDQALILLDRARKLAPQRPDVVIALARALKDGGYYGDSALAYDEYVKMRPDDESARRDRALVYGQTGSRVDDGIRELTWYIRKHPDDPVGHYNLGLLYSVTDDQKALAQFSTAVSLQRGSELARYARYSRAVVFCRLGRVAEAVPDLRAVLDRDPNDLRALDQLGQALLTLERPEEAKAVLRRAAQISPNDGKVLWPLSRALMATGQDDEARVILSQLEQYEPPKSGKLQRAGLLEYLSLSRAEQRARSLSNLKKAIIVRPKDPDLQLHVARLLLEDSKTDEAITVLTALLSLAPSATIALEAGRLSIQYEQYALAREFLERAAANDPIAHLDMAVAIFYSRTPEEALVEIEKVPEDKRTGSFYLMKAQILDALGSEKAAGEALETGYQAAPLSADFCYRAALLLFKEHRDEQAVSLLNRAEKRLPNEPELLLAKASGLELLGRCQDAEELLKRLQAMWPEWDRTYLVYGAILQSHSRYKDARRNLEAAIALGARMAEAYYYLALAIADGDARNTEGAFTAVSRALTLRPDYAAAHALAGRILMQQGSPAEATKHFQQAKRGQGELVQAHHGPPPGMEENNPIRELLASALR